MGWQSITVSVVAGDEVAAQLLDVANDSSTWSLANFGATVIRLNAGALDRFYFSPHAAALFQAVIAKHEGGPCDPPLARQLVPSRTSRLLLGFKSRWEPFQAPRRVSTPQGIPTARPPDEDKVTR